MTDNRDKAKLLPCPCKGTAHVRNETDADDCYWSWVECQKCGLRTRGKWVSHRSNTCPLHYESVREEWNNTFSGLLSQGGEWQDEITVRLTRLEAMAIRSVQEYIGGAFNENTYREHLHNVCTKMVSAGLPGVHQEDIDCFEGSLKALPLPSPQVKS